MVLDPKTGGMVPCPKGDPGRPIADDEQTADPVDWVELQPKYDRLRAALMRNGAVGGIIAVNSLPRVGGVRPYDDPYNAR